MSSEGDSLERDFEEVGRSLLVGEAGSYRVDVWTAFHDLEDDVHPTTGEAVTPEHVDELRQAIIEAQWFVETYVAPLAGVTPWPPRLLNRVPYGTITGILEERDSRRDRCPEQAER